MSLATSTLSQKHSSNTVVANPPKTLIGWTAKGSANPDAAVYISRRRVNDAFLRAALESFHKDGPAAFEKCARENPASYLKIFALLVPRELKIEHANPTSGLSDEQLALMVAELEERIARRVAGESAKLVEAEAEPVARGTLPPPKPRKRRNALLEHVDSAGYRAKRRRSPSDCDNTSEATTVPEPPKRKPNRLMMEADTAIGPRERKPRKRMAKPPGKRDAD
jgi:hypothetical protein